jgi:hypothetical protein
MFTYLWCQIQLIIPSCRFRSIECRHFDLFWKYVTWSLFPEWWAVSGIIDRWSWFYLHIYAVKYVYFWILHRRLARHWGAGIIHASSWQGYMKKNSQIELCMVDKGFGGRQYQKTILASNGGIGSIKWKSRSIWKIMWYVWPEIKQHAMKYINAPYIFAHRYTSFLTEAALTKAESTKAGSSRKRRLFGANFQICFMTWWWQKDLFSFFSRIYMARWCISWRVVLFRVIHITLFSRLTWIFTLLTQSPHSKPELFSDIACLRIPYQPCIVLFGGKSDHVTYFQNKSKWRHSMDLKRQLGMMSCIWHHR